MTMRALDRLLRLSSPRPIRRRRVRQRWRQRFEHARARLQFTQETRRARLKPQPLGLWGNQRKMARVLDELMDFPFHDEPVHYA